MTASKKCALYGCTEPALTDGVGRWCKYHWDRQKEGERLGYVVPRTESKRIYIAGASANIELHERFNREVIEAGWTITCDWCAAVRAAGNVASPDDPQVRREAALADLEGVATADVFWLVQPEGSATSTGCWVELGYALALQALGMSRPRGIYGPIVVSGSSKKCIFADLADYRFQSHDDALDFINRDLARPRRIVPDGDRA